MIIDALTGQTYLSPSHAAEAIGVSLPTALKSIKTGAAIKHRSLNTYTWLVGPMTPELQVPVDNRQRIITCVTTGITYDTMSEAAKAHNLDLTALSRAIRHGKTIRGLKFE